MENIVFWPSLGGLLLRGGAAYTEAGGDKTVVTIDSFTLEGKRPFEFELPLLKLTDSTDFRVQDAPRWDPSHHSKDCMRPHAGFFLQGQVGQPSGDGFQVGAAAKQEAGGA